MAAALTHRLGEHPDAPVQLRVGGLPVRDTSVASATREAFECNSAGRTESFADSIGTEAMLTPPVGALSRKLARS